MSVHRQSSTRQASQDREASLRRVAIVLNSLPAPLAAKLLSSFDPDKRSRLRKTMTGLSDVDPLERKRAIESFSGSMHQGVGSQTIGVSDARGAQQSHVAHASDDFVIHAEGPKHAGAGQSAPGFETDRVDQHPLSFLSRVPNPQVADILREEHPQTVAVVLASIPPDNAAKILPGLPQAIRDDVIRRIGRMTRVEPDMLSDVADLLKARCMEIDLPRETEPGSNALRAIMAKMQVPESSLPDERVPPPSTLPNDTPHNDRLGHRDVDDAMKVHATDHDAISNEAGLHIASGSQHDSTDRPPLSTDEVNTLLQSLSPADLCISLGRVSAREALLTLCGLPMKHANRAIAMLPKPQQKMTRQQLANLGPLQLAEIDRAKERVAQASQSDASLPVAA